MDYLKLVNDSIDCQIYKSDYSFEFLNEGMKQTVRQVRDCLERDRCYTLCQFIRFNQPSTVFDPNLDFIMNYTNYISQIISNLEVQGVEQGNP